MLVEKGAAELGSQTRGDLRRGFLMRGIGGALAYTSDQLVISNICTQRDSTFFHRVLCSVGAWSLDQPGAPV